jgi:hypothetical protein
MGVNLIASVRNLRSALKRLLESPTKCSVGAVRRARTYILSFDFLALQRTQF